MDHDQLARLERLAKLRSSGAISAAEFEAAKAQMAEPPRPRWQVHVAAGVLALALALMAAAAVLRVGGEDDTQNGSVESAANGGGEASVAAGRPNLVVGSQVSGLRITRLQQIPLGPREPVDAYCEHYLTELASEAGQHVTRRGWVVTRELPLGELTAVSFVRRLEPGTSGTCSADGGNVGIFDGSTLIALIYGEGPEHTILTLSETGDRHRIRIIPGAHEVPYAELSASRDVLHVRPLSATEPICSGSSTVPNIFGAPIGEARSRLFAFGWRPHTAATAVEGERAEGSSGSQLPETVGCSGTGYGLCEFSYINDRGDQLSVVTAGEDGPVEHYRAECR